MFPFLLSRFPIMWLNLVFQTIGLFFQLYYLVDQSLQFVLLVAWNVGVLLFLVVAGETGVMLAEEIAFSDGSYRLRALEALKAIVNPGVVHRNPEKLILLMGQWFFSSVLRGTGSAYGG